MAYNPENNLDFANYMLDGFQEFKNRVEGVTNIGARQVCIGVVRVIPDGSRDGGPGIVPDLLLRHGMDTHEVKKTAGENTFTGAAGDYGVEAEVGRKKGG